MATKKKYMWLAFYFCWTDVNAALLEVLFVSAQPAQLYRGPDPRAPTPLSYTEDTCGSTCTNSFFLALHVGQKELSICRGMELAGLAAMVAYPPGHQ